MESVLLAARGISKRYGPVQALNAMDISIPFGEFTAITGHNGAGKSTLIKVLSGRVRSDTGSISIRDTDVTTSYSIKRARQLGVRAVDQELSLCGNLTVVENFLIKHPEIAGWRWRRRAEAACREALDQVFPENKISLRMQVNRFPMAQRQMIDIACSTYESKMIRGPKLLILDEPTSSLDEERRSQLFHYLKALSSTGVSIVLISHRLDEVLANATRVLVLRDGAMAGVMAALNASRESLIELMGQAGSADPKKSDVTSRRRVTGDARAKVAGSPRQVASLRHYTGSGLSDLSADIAEGEIVGLGGLEGQGQQTLLNTIFDAGRRRRKFAGVTIDTPAAYVSGDRNGEGVFPLWSIVRNISVGSLSALSRGGGVSVRAERELASHWMRRLDVKAAGPESLITTLSGGSQQKILIARVLASGARLILLNDPTRGVDIGTKREIYALVRTAASEGRSFLWYSTENEELRECDRVLVMRDGRIVRELSRAAVDEQSLISASFITGESSQ